MCLHCRTSNATTRPPNVVVTNCSVTRRIRNGRSAAAAGSTGDTRVLTGQCGCREMAIVARLASPTVLRHEKLLKIRSHPRPDCHGGASAQACKTSANNWRFLTNPPERSRRVHSPGGRPGGGSEGSPSVSEGRRRRTDPAVVCEVCSGQGPPRAGAPMTGSSLPGDEPVTMSTSGGSHWQAGCRLFAPGALFFRSNQCQKVLA